MYGFLVGDPLGDDEGEYRRGSRDGSFRLAPEPACCFSRFRGIDKRDHALMNVIACGI
jgi:hypothetical protein